MARLALANASTLVASRGALRQPREVWRWAFIGGLVVGARVAAVLHPAAFVAPTPTFGVTRPSTACTYVFLSNSRAEIGLAPPYACRGDAHP